MIITTFQIEKTRAERDEHIYKLWAVDKLSYAQIACMLHPSCMCLRRVRNIVYAGPPKPGMVKPQTVAVYKVFRLHFLETQSVKASILYAYYHQPDILLTERTVRNIVNRQLLLNKSKKQCINTF